MESSVESVQLHGVHHLQPCQRQNAGPSAQTELANCHRTADNSAGDSALRA